METIEMGTEDGTSLVREIQKLRELLWLHHDRTSTHMLYGDDGEIQCNTCQLDFKRDSIDKIVNTLEQNNFSELIEAIQLRDESTKVIDENNDGR